MHTQSTHAFPNYHTQSHPTIRSVQLVCCAPFPTLAVPTDASGENFRIRAADEKFTSFVDYSRRSGPGEGESQLTMCERESIRDQLVPCTLSVELIESSINPSQLSRSLARTHVDLHSRHGLVGGGTRIPSLSQLATLTAFLLVARFTRIEHSGVGGAVENSSTGCPLKEIGVGVSADH